VHPRQLHRRGLPRGDAVAPQAKTVGTQRAAIVDEITGKAPVQVVDPGRRGERARLPRAQVEQAQRALVETAQLPVEQVVPVLAQRVAVQGAPVAAQQQAGPARCEFQLPQVRLAAAVTGLGVIQQPVVGRQAAGHGRVPAGREGELAGRTAAQVEAVQVEAVVPADIVNQDQEPAAMVHQEPVDGLPRTGELAQRAVAQVDGEHVVHPPVATQHVQFAVIRGEGQLLQRSGAEKPLEGELRRLGTDADRPQRNLP